MKDHPMLLMRDPPPILDVTRPALPKVLVDPGKPGGDMTAAVKYTRDAQGNICVQEITVSEFYKEPAAQVLEDECQNSLKMI